MSRIANAWKALTKSHKDTLKAPPLGQLGAMGSSRTFGPLKKTGTSTDDTVLAFRLDSVTLEEYDRLRLDPAVRMGLLLFKIPLLQAARNFKVTCEDPVIALFCQKILKDHMVHLMSSQLNALDFGYAISEIVWTAKDIDLTKTLANSPTKDKINLPGAWVFHKFGHLDPRYIHPKVFINTGELAAVAQRIGGRLDIPANKVVHYAFQAEYEEVFGTPLTKPALPIWELKQFALENWNLFLQNCGNPFKELRYPDMDIEAGVDEDGKPLYISGQQYALQLGKELKGLDTVALPSGVDANGNKYWELNFKTVEPNVDFISALNYYDAQMQMGMLAPILLVGAPTAGSGRALVSVQERILYNNIQGIGTDICQKISDGPLKQAILFNFGSGALSATVSVSVDTSTINALIGALIQRWSQGEPLMSADGTAIIPDFSKLAEEADLPVQTMTSDQIKDMYGQNENENTDENKNADKNKKDNQGDSGSNENQNLHD